MQKATHLRIPELLMNGGQVIVNMNHSLDLKMP